jgi:signal recognition particle subunit SRP54
MFENLNVKIEQAFRNFKGQGKITEVNVANTMKDIRRALLDADVNYNVAKDFTNRVKDKALGEKILISVKPGQMLVKIVQDELTELMGSTATEINFSQQPPTVILIAGLQGSGKTTFSGKLARMLKSKGRNPILVAGDVYRPAAIEQLSTLGSQISVDVYKEEGNKNPVQIAENGIDFAKKNHKDVVIIDTAGRLAVDEEMMEEISNIKSSVSPHEILFVVDAMTGQDAVNTAKAFNDRLDFDGVVLTKMDGDTRGGAAISIREVVTKPIKFISQGEKLDALDVFHPDRMATRILGMGDVVSLVDKVQQQFDEDQARKLQAKIKKNELDFDDFLSQISAIEKMGNIKDLISMVPGMGKLTRNLDIDDNAFKHIKAIIRSMTRQERENPRLLNGSRRRRIADGAGRPVREVNELLKHFEQMKKTMRQMNKMQQAGKMAKGMGNMNMLRRGGGRRR